MLCGRRPEQPTIAKVLSILEPEVLVAQAIQARGEGYRHLKMKLCSDDWQDIELVRAVLAAICNDMAILVYANQSCGYTATALTMIRALVPFAIHLVEQPILADDIDGFRLLR